jgi:undecaprenyl-diphosphatase
VSNDGISTEPPVSLPPVWPYALAFSALLVLGVAFGEMARAARRAVPDGLDVRILSWVSRHHQEWPGIERLFSCVTVFGNLEVATPVTVLMAIFLYLLGRRRVGHLRSREALFWLVVAVGAWSLCTLLKLWFQRQRPDLSLRRALVNDHSFSFPSCHSVFAAVFFTMLALLLIRGVPRFLSWLRDAAIALCAALALLVGTSRVWLCVHYPTDVAGGLMLRVAWVILAYVIRFGWAYWRLWERSRMA